ncbi:phage tail protein [Agromyces intestinalis]|uniref:phage tail protein n=1 Tax=Agromyces intestinalis TaxID=2592652 RepID=UPI00143DC706|nr:hypothetical protein [Agromyces intestinalis]
MAGAPHSVATRAAVTSALADARHRGAGTAPHAPAGRAGAVLALQRTAGNAAVSALMAAKLKWPSEQAGSEIDAALRELRRDEPAIDTVEQGLKQAKAVGVPVDLEGPKPPAAALAVTKTGFGPGSVAGKKPVPPPKPVPAVSPLGKAAAAKPKAAGPAKPASPVGAMTAGGGAAAGGAAAGAAASAPLSADKLLLPPEPPAHTKPAQDPAFAKVAGGVKAVGAAKRAHPPAAAKAQEAQGAAVAPADDLAGQAKAAKADTMDAQQPGSFDKKAFIAAVKAAIEAKSPKTLKEADDAAKSGKAGDVKGEIKGLVGQGTNESAKDIEQATDAPPDTSKAVAKPVTPLAPENPGPAPSVPAAGAVPKPAPPEQTNLQAGKQQVGDEMAQANVTDQQLAESNEPEFQGALADKQEAAKHADTAPAEYRSQEQATIEQSRADASATTAAGMQGMQGSKAAALAQLVAQKGKAKSKDEQKRAEVTAKIQSIFAATETDVKQLLDGIDPKVEKAFETGEASARAAFESYVSQKMSAYKADRYGGWLGGLRWAKDKLFGMPAKVDEFYEAGRELYLKRMDGVISGVADIVATDLTKAKQRIAKGRAEIAAYVKSLPQDLQKVGSEAATEIGDRFEQLESDVNDKQNEVVETLASKYVEARSGLDERIEALQAENKGLVDKAIGAIKAVINTIRELVAMLTNALARAVSVIGDIIAAPVKFLGNLIAGVKGGIEKFFNGIEEHLKKGLMGWLFGQLGDAGIELPDSFDIKGIVKLVASVFGLTWTNIRNRIVKQIGDTAMNAVEKGVEIFQIMKDQGIGGLWQKLVEKIGDIKAMIMEQLQDFVVTKIIVAGIQWLIGLLNPAAAFIKACKLIYDVVMFFVNNAARIAEFVNTVLDGVVEIARGNVSVVVDKVDQALGRMVPILIGFMASVLGIGGIGEKIRSILKAIQRPITKAIDAIIKGGLKLAGPIIRGIKGISTRVKAKVAAGKAWVKGKAEAGKQWVKGKVADLRGGRGSVREARDRADRVLTAPGATLESVRGALPAIRSEYGLARAELVSGRAPNTYHVHVQREDANTPDRPVAAPPAAATTAEQLARATSLVGTLIVIGRTQEEWVVAKVDRVDAATQVVYCSFVKKTGRGPKASTSLARGFPVAKFLKNHDETKDELRPHTGGIHKSKYVVEGPPMGKFFIAPEYKKKWRSLFYGTDYGPVVDAMKLRRLTTTYGVGDGLRHKDDVGKHPGQRWFYENVWYENVHKGVGEATLDHDPTVVSHFNGAGKNTDQATRKAWYGQGKFEIVPRSVNSSWGSENEDTQSREKVDWDAGVGMDFRGPGESA